MDIFEEYLKGGDLRSIGSVEKLVPLIKDQNGFDELFEYLCSEDRLIVMRAIDAVEKITIEHPEYLKPHTHEIIEFLNTADNKEFKWHLAQMVIRLDFSPEELETVCNRLTNWSKDKKESKIVRVNSIQALFDLAKKYEDLDKNFRSIIQEVEKENVPSLNARIRQLK